MLLAVSIALSESESNSMSVLNSELSDAVLSVNENTPSQPRTKDKFEDTRNDASVSHDDIDFRGETQGNISVHTPSKSTDDGSPIGLHLVSLSRVAEHQVNTAEEIDFSISSQTLHDNLAVNENTELQSSQKLTIRSFSYSPDKTVFKSLESRDISSSRMSDRNMVVQEKKVTSVQRDSKGRFLPKAKQAGGSQPGEQPRSRGKKGQVSDESAEIESVFKHDTLSASRGEGSTDLAENLSESQGSGHEIPATKEKRSAKRKRAVFSVLGHHLKETPIPPPKRLYASDGSSPTPVQPKSENPDQRKASTHSGLLFLQSSTTNDTQAEASRTRSSRTSLKTKTKTSLPAERSLSLKSISSSPLSSAYTSRLKSTPTKKETPIPPPPVRPYLTSSSPIPQTSPHITELTETIENNDVKPKRKRAPAKSPYFPTTPKKPTTSPSKPTSSSKKRTGLSCMPFPPLSSSTFGLIQERLAHDPFRLLIAVTFLNRTHGKHAIPVFYELMSKFPTPEALLAADKEKDILPVIQHLGLQNQRATTYQAYAKLWIEERPRRGRRFRVLGYPRQRDGRDVAKGEVLSDEDDFVVDVEGEEGKRDERVAWEIGHMTQGPYALDSFRIFCRDELRGLADSWNGEGAAERQHPSSQSIGDSSYHNASAATNDNITKKASFNTQSQKKEVRTGIFQPEWMRVVPLDKELRAYLRWMWLKEGFEWDPFTGEKEVASPELMRAAMEGRLEWDDAGGMRIVDEEEVGTKDEKHVEEKREDEATTGPAYG